MPTHQHSVLHACNESGDILHPVTSTDDGELKVSPTIATTQRDQVKVSSAGGVAVYADSSPTPIADLDDRSGWLFKKTASDATKFNYYAFGASGSSHTFTVSELKSVHLTCSVDNYQNSGSVPFIVVHTKPTGTNDAESWHHSRRAYALDVGSNVVLAGEHINLYALAAPTFNNTHRSLPLTSVATSGDYADTEEILFISVHSDSSALVNTQILVAEMGYSFPTINRNIKLIT